MKALVYTMLNRAHALRRQAERAARKDNFDEAVKYHNEAADLLHQLLENILDEKFAESIRLQAQLHKKEKMLLTKKAENAYQESAITNMSNKEADHTSKFLDKLQPFDEAVGMKGTRDFIAVSSDYLNNNSNQDEVVVGLASKRPKDDKVIIEELEVTNCHLRKMVDSLLYELNPCQRENLELKTQVRYLESMQVTGGGGIIPPQSPPSHKTMLQSQSAQQNPNLGIQVLKTEHHSPVPIKTEVTSAFGGANPGPPLTQMTSFSASQSISNSQLSNDLEANDANGSDFYLPTLPSLEMPNFDFDNRNKA